MNNPAGEHRVRVLVVDDHPIVRRGIAKLLEHECDFEMVGEAGDGPEALEAAIRLRPDVVLMDLSMPRLDGIDATKQIVEAAPSVKVVGFSMQDDPHASIIFKLAGAVAYVPQNSEPADLCSSVRDAAGLRKAAWPNKR